MNTADSREEEAHERGTASSRAGTTTTKGTNGATIASEGGGLASMMPPLSKPTGPRYGASAGLIAKYVLLGTLERRRPGGTADDVREARLLARHLLDHRPDRDRRGLHLEAPVHPGEVPAAGHAVPARLRGVSDLLPDLHLDDELRNRQQPRQADRDRADRGQLDQRERRLDPLRPADPRRRRRAG